MERAHLLAEFAREFAEASSQDLTAAAVVQRAKSTVPDADHVSLTLRARRGRFLTLASTDDRASELDALQYALAEGPCVAASRGHDWYRSGEVGADPRWPRWGPKAREVGVESLLSISLMAEDSTFGALNWYSRTTGAFSDPDDVDFALVFATHGALALSVSRQVSGLETAIQSRHLIGAAQGILMERYGLDLDRSFALLQRYSSITNTKVVQLARDLVETGRIPVLDRATEAATPSRAVNGTSNR
jgi:GAF domain-containing protein